jgi:hypothetical protein
VLLETQDHLGGRAWTRKFADTEINVDMGGAWIHRRNTHAMEEDVPASAFAEAGTTHAERRYRNARLAGGES